ncbi:MAG TPA: flagellar basal-body MS-ring/collar protein FliF [Pyrinomonadaceae bacterium]
MSFFSQLADIWSKMKPGQRMAVMLGAVGTVALIGALVYYGSQPEYGVLFSDLKPADAQAIVEKLKTANVQYKLTNNGTVVSVPNDRISELRLQMASSGALSGGHVGFDIFDRTSFGATDFTQQVNYQRAIEGELARTIEGMNEVESARVHITQPHDSLYSEKTQRAKASVMVRMRQDRALSRERTDAVVSLVASAVDGLDPADVAVMDTQGRLLSNASGAGGDAGAFSSHLDARRKLEAETAARIVSLIEPISGIGHVRADVAADLDFSQVEQTEEKYDPKSQVVRSQQSTQESRNTNAPNQGNITGARANDPTIANPPVATAKPATSGDQRVATTTSYEIDKTVKHTTGGGGRINRMSVSVVVDYKNVSGVTTARSNDELTKIQNLVSAAVGIDTNRGDQIVVQTIPFDQPTVEVRNPTFLEKNNDLVRTAIKYGALVVAALLLLLFVIRPAKKALKLAGKTQSLPAGPAPLALPPGNEMVRHGELDSPRTVAEIEADMEAQVAREMNQFAPDVARAGALKKQLVERSRKNPEAVAMTIRGWLQENQR